MLSFGEAMMRFAPDSQRKSANPLIEPQIRSIGGDELNVCVDLAKLGMKTTWVSALGEDPMSKQIKRASEAEGVQVIAPAIPGEFIGEFHVYPEEKRVYYNRRHSAFARHSPSLFNWPALVANKSWLHMTGITPMCGPNALKSWQLCMDAGLAANLPVSMDFNHRPQLGTLQQLWGITRPYASRLKFLILSIGSLLDLVREEALHLDFEADMPAADPRYGGLMLALRHRLQCEVLIVCFKTRDERGVQRRWSVAASALGLSSTNDCPVFHRVTEELGGGSAFAAGVIHYMMEQKTDSLDSLAAALRRGDLLAALCQETEGDWSSVTLEQLMKVEKAHVKKPFYLLPERTFLSAEQKQANLKRFLEAKVVTILRAKNGTAAIQRGQELANLGCRALEVTTDTENFEHVLSELVRTVGDKCLVGVGTIMRREQVARAAELGAVFALAPINPAGFIEECRKFNLIAVPAAFSPNEVWSQHLEGADVIKLFPAQLYNPDTLKALKGIGQFAQINIAPSGGQSPATFKKWLAAGAVTIGMGSNLAGSDIGFAFGTPEYEKANQEWISKGRAAAAALFADINTTSSRL